MRMDAGLDTGDIVSEVRTPIDPRETGQTLHDRLAQLGGELVVRALPDWLNGRLMPRPQPNEGVTYARKLQRESGHLDWTAPASVLDRRIRAFHPWPGAFTTGPGGLLKVWEAAPWPDDPGGEPGEVRLAAGDDLVVRTGEGGLRLCSVQREGRRRMTAREFLAGGGLKPGDRLGTPAPLG